MAFKFNMGQLKHFPVLFFASVMGLSGFSMVVRKVGLLLGLSPLFGELAAYGTLIVYGMIVFTYLRKLYVYPSTVLHEALHPSYIGFVSTITLSTILLATILFPYNVQLSKLLWMVGSVAHLTLLLRITSLWISYQGFTVQDTNPAWFIPVVGSLAVPLVGIDHAPVEMSWFFFSIGLLFWLVLFTIILYRILFHHPLAQKLVPTLFILMAPPSLAALSWTRLTGELSEFGIILYSIALFMFLLVLVQYKLYFQLREFYLSWWTFSFPLSAMAMATFLFSTMLGSAVLEKLAWVQSALLLMIVMMLIYRTLAGLFRGEICREEVIVDPATRSHEGM
ncbi:MAG: SLAC1 anion channel family protein [Pseudomonadota bacterium]